mmetsp:Transcript_928/g.2160  ORF Transcript_928/g.2160 Transcript_928/m.2160 type:complete len:261 (+) Transcript_928:40-822(+)
MIITASLATFASVAAGAATFLLSAASLSNVYEMHSTVSQHQLHQRQLEGSRSTSTISSASMTSQILERTRQWKTTVDARIGLQNMSRQDLIQLFLQCETPSLDELSGYTCDGYLLDNGPILSHVTSFITNKLFGRGKPWLGKVYYSFRDTGITDEKRIEQTQQTLSNDKNELTERPFDYYVGASSITPQCTSLINNYAPHCRSWNPMSLIRRGMVDELRILPLQGKKDNEEGVVLIGMGYFTWSGGALNSAPFCLITRRC